MPPQAATASPRCSTRGQRKSVHGRRATNKNPICTVPNRNEAVGAVNAPFPYVTCQCESARDDHRRGAPALNPACDNLFCSVLFGRRRALPLTLGGAARARDGKASKALSVPSQTPFCPAFSLTCNKEHARALKHKGVHAFAKRKERACLLSQVFSCPAARLLLVLPAVCACLGYVRRLSSARAPRRMPKTCPEIRQLRVLSRSACLAWPGPAHCRPSTLSVPACKRLL